MTTYTETCGKCLGAKVVNFGNVTFVGKDGTSARHCFACKGTGTVTFKTSPEARAKARLKREEKKRAEWEARQQIVEAELQKERDRNGGKTDAQLFDEKLEAAKNAFVEKAQPIIDRLARMPENFYFAHNIREDLEKARMPNGRGLDILLDILAKQNGRRNSKKYWEEHDELSDLFEFTLKPLREAYENLRPY